VNGGHEDDCPIVLFFEELGLPKSRLYRPEEPEREYTGPPLTLEEVDTILKAYTKKLKLQSASAISYRYSSISQGVIKHRTIPFSLRKEYIIEEY